MICRFLYRDARLSFRIKNDLEDSLKPRTDHLLVSGLNCISIAIMRTLRLK